ncbi:MAG: hypothetical protein Q9159_002654 [Coniocarpon cinnabarinum]
MSRVPHELAYVRGRIVTELSELHRKYGDVVRVSPNGLSFIHPDAWADIYARKAGQDPWIKDPLRYTKDLWINGEPEVWTADPERHPRLRHLLSPIFSEKAVRSQEPLIQSHLDLLIASLKQNARSKSRGKVDLSSWMNWTLFDIISDLAFGESFGCAKSQKYHPLVALVSQSAKVVSFLGAIKQFPWLDTVFQVLIGSKMTKILRDHQNVAIDMVDRRMSKVTNRGDFMDVMLKSRDEEGITTGEIYSNANLLMMAGSETTAQALSGCFYHITKYPSVARALTSEIRRSVAHESELNFDVVAGLPLLTATLQESMRMYPGQPIFNPRISPAGGASVAGYAVPEGVSYKCSTFFPDRTRPLT